MRGSKDLQILYQSTGILRLIGWPDTLFEILFWPFLLFFFIVVENEMQSSAINQIICLTFSFFTLTQGSLEKLSVSAIWISAFSSSLVKSLRTCKRVKERDREKAVLVDEEWHTVSQPKPISLIYDSVHSNLRWISHQRHAVHIHNSLESVRPVL